MFCTRCGSKIADNATFCPTCGARIGAAPGAAMPGAVPGTVPGAMPPHMPGVAHAPGAAPAIHLDDSIVQVLVLALAAIALICSGAGLSLPDESLSEQAANELKSVREDVENSGRGWLYIDDVDTRLYSGFNALINEINHTDKFVGRLYEYEKRGEAGDWNSYQGAAHIDEDIDQLPNTLFAVSLAAKAATVAGALLFFKERKQLGLFLALGGSAVLLVLSIASMVVVNGANGEISQSLTTIASQVDYLTSAKNNLAYYEMQKVFPTWFCPLTILGSLASLALSGTLLITQQKH